jgi:hypothetical protein
MPQKKQHNETAPYRLTAQGWAYLFLNANFDPITVGMMADLTRIIEKATALAAREAVDAALTPGVN